VTTIASNRVRARGKLDCGRESFVDVVLQFIEKEMGGERAPGKRKRWPAITTAINGALPTLTARRKWIMGRGRNGRREVPLRRGSERHDVELRCVAAVGLRIGA
jgi:hypothetical protein